MPERIISQDGEIFLGRVDEQERFRDGLRGVKAKTSVFARMRGLLDDEDKPEIPIVFLISGIGGMGKTRLTRRLCDIARQEEEFKGDFTVLYLDWEERKEKDLRLNTHEAVTAEAVYENIYSLFRDAGFGREFDDYEDAVRKRADAETDVSKELNQKTEGGDRYAILRELGGKGLVWLVRSGAVGGVPIPVPEEPTAKAFEAIIGGGAEALARAREQATTFLRATLTDPDAFDLFILPNETLARKLASGIRAAARSKPIVIAMDTYEIADSPDPWLREAIKNAGQRTVWIISGRNDLAESRSQYGQSAFRGYRSDFPSEHLRVLPLGEFSLQDIAEYFSWRAPDRPLDSVSLDAIGHATLSIPLAVREAAALWASGNTLETITGDIPERAGREKIVQIMTERFLLHCLHDPQHPDDKEKLYAMALAHRPDPDLLAAMLESDNLEADLGDLERRHSFVFIGEMKLHAAAEAFLREYLMHELRRSSIEVKAIHQRAIDHLEERRKDREKSALTLEARVDDERWVNSILGLTHHQFWLGEDEGFDILIPAFIGGLAYDQDFARSLLEAADSISESFTRKGAKRLKTLQKGLGWRLEEEEEHKLLTELDSTSKLWQRDDNTDERRAILALRTGQSLLRRGKKYDALVTYEAATAWIPADGKVLTENFSSALSELSSQFIWPENSFTSKPTKEGEKASALAFRLYPNNGFAAYNYAVALDENGESEKAIEFHLKAIEINNGAAEYNALGRAYSNLNRYDDAIAAYQQAIEIDPAYSYAYNGLGVVYSHLDRHDEAIAAYQQAIKIDPAYSNAHTGLGSVYRALSRHDEAMAAYQQAIDIDPANANPHISLGNVYHDLSRYEEAIAAFERAIELNPDHAYAHNGLGVANVITGDFEKALLFFLNAAQIEPENGSIQSSIISTLLRLGRDEEAQRHMVTARNLIATDSAYNRACFESVCGNADEAVALLRLALDKKQTPIEWARQDPDFDNIRGNPTYRSLVGL